MKLQICAVYDTKAKIYEAPFFVPHVAIATRGFMELCKKADSPVGKYPEDFELHKLGVFENEKQPNNIHCQQFDEIISVLLRGKDLVQKATEDQEK